jgi:hypothetical protein
MKTKKGMFDWLTQVCVNPYVGDYTPTERAFMALDTAQAWRSNEVNVLFGGADKLFDKLLAYYEERA